MNKKLCVVMVVLWSSLFTPIGFGWVKGIYLTQSTLESSGKLRYLIDESKSVGINTFVIDVNRKSVAFDRNIKWVTNSGINFVARIVVFPQGATMAEVDDDHFWQRRMNVINYALDCGAKVIQLDYIRYNTKVRPSEKNAQDISEVIGWFKSQVNKRGAKLQVDVFGETSYKPSLRIGQNVKAFAHSIDSLSPMLYPSHWEPYVYHSKNPYDTVYKSLRALDHQFGKDTPFPVIAYIETSNYRYHIEGQERLDYIYAQLKAVEDGGAQGWYAWSANNYYHGLFRVLHHYTDLR
jgi:hypothetical protein